MTLDKDKIGTQSYGIDIFPLHMPELIQFSEQYEESKSLNAGYFERKKRVSIFVFSHCFAL